jgi:hypothetical protein
MAATTRLAVLLCASALTLSACGSSAKDSASDFRGDQKLVAQTVEDLQSASRKGDESKICTDLLAPALLTKIKAAQKAGCEPAMKTALKDVDSYELTVKKVAISGTTATATVTDDVGKDDDRTGTLTLVKVGNAWKISELGSVS